MIVVIDADALLYQSSKDDITTSILEINSRIRSIQEGMSADKFIIVLSADNYFRSNIFSEYKAKRKPSELKYIQTLKNYLIEQYRALIIPKLEADDVLCYLRTKCKELYSEDCCIASTDKDVLKQIPGTHWDYYHGTEVSTTTEEANIFLLRQWVTGDATDNIPGIRGKGEKAADKLVTKDFKTSIHNILDAYVETYGVEKGIEEFYVNFKMVYILKKEEQIISTVGEESLHLDIDSHININPIIKTEW